MKQKATKFICMFVLNFDIFYSKVFLKDLTIFNLSGFSLLIFIYFYLFFSKCNNNKKF